MSSQSSVIRGILTFQPLPCTTQPCLPGMAVAVTSDDGTDYLLVQKDNFYMPESDLAAALPAIGSTITARGMIVTKKDSNDTNYTTIELDELNIIH